jgi:hypothetical protein
MAEATSLISLAITSFQSLIANKKLDTDQARSAISSLNSALDGLKHETVRLRDENLKLFRELQAVRQQMQPAEMIFRDGKYFRRDAATNEQTGPYCIGCYTKDRKLVDLKKLDDADCSLGQWECPNCLALAR